MALFTPEELEELRVIDAEIDAEEMTDEDWRTSDFIDSILFPEKARANARKRAANAERRQAIIREYGEEALKKKYKADYQKVDKEAERERKKIWYQQNKDRILAQQKAYRIRSGRNISPEQRAEKKAATEERRRTKKEQS